MTSFAEILAPATRAALAAVGIRKPTPFQAAAIPVVRRGRDLIALAGPGGGTLIGYSAPLLDRLDFGQGSPACVAICTGSRQATDLARSLAPVCTEVGARAAALGDLWAHPERADFLFVPAERASALYDGTVAIESVGAVVLHDGDGVVASVPSDLIEVVLAGLPKGCQRIFCGHPCGPALRSLAGRYSRRPATIPPGLGHGANADGATDRRRSAASRRPRRATTEKPSREVGLVVLRGDRAEAALALVANTLRGGGRILVHAESAAAAAGLREFLALHGYECGPPGSASVSVWVSDGDDAAARGALDDAPDSAGVSTLSLRVPPGAEATSLRHGAGGPAWMLAAVRELGHARQVARDAGLGLKRVRPDRPRRVSETLDELADEIDRAARDPRVAPYYLLVESLADRHAPAETAAAALLLLDRARGKPTRKPVGAGAERAPESWARLFVSAGRRDKIGAGDLLGAIARRSEIPGSRVGRIDVRDGHSLVEVREGDARAVISALNGITLGGRGVRADYDRARTKRPGGARSAAPHGRGNRPASRGRPKGRGAKGRSDDRSRAVRRSPRSGGDVRGGRPGSRRRRPDPP